MPTQAPARQPSLSTQQALGLRAEHDSAEAELGVEHVQEQEIGPGNLVRDERGRVQARFRYGVEQMTYGRKILCAPEYDEKGICTRTAELGDFNYHDFDEGGLYWLPLPLFCHLAERGILQGMEDFELANHPELQRELAASNS